MKSPLFASLGVLYFAAAGFADTASKAAKVDEIFQLTKVDQMQKQMLEQVKPMIPSLELQAGVSQENKALSDQLTSKILDLIADRVSWEKMKPAMTELYSETFSEEEIDGMLSFYKSPSGQAMLTKMPSLMAKTMGLAQEQLADIIPEIQKLTVDFLSKHQKDAAAPAPAPKQ